MSKKHSPEVQLDECRALNAEVAGSKPARGSSNILLPFIPCKRAWYISINEISSEEIKRRYKAITGEKKMMENTFTTNAEAIICGETFDVRIVSGPNHDDLVTVDVPFEDGAFVERVAVTKKNVFPSNEEAIEILMA